MTSLVAVLAIVIVLAPLFILNGIKSREYDWRVLGAMGVLAAMAATFISYQQDGPWGVPLTAALVAVTLYIIGLATHNTWCYIVALIVGVLGSLGAGFIAFIAMIWRSGGTVTLGSVVVVILGLLVLLAAVLTPIWLRRRRSQMATKEPAQASSS